MAKGSTKTAETVYVLELTKREANALTELLLAANMFKGEGDALDDIYCELVDVGAETGECFHEIVEGSVVVSRGDG